MLIENQQKLKLTKGTCHSASYMSQTRDQQHFTTLVVGSGKCLARANDTAAHYAAIHCPRQQTKWTRSQARQEQG